MKHYRQIAQQYPGVSLRQERPLIALAQKGSKVSADEIVLRHIGFVIFRLHKCAFPGLVRRYGEDLVSESIPILYRQIERYDLRYRYKDSCGRSRPVKFVSYIWKRIDGFLIDSLKKEYARERREVPVFV